MTKERATSHLPSRSKPFLAIALICLSASSFAQNNNGSSSTNAPTTVAKRLAPALDPQARRQQLVGRWYGESKTADGRRLRWLTERDAGGTYRTQYFMTPPDGSNSNELESIELGQWGISGSVLFTIQRLWIKGEETQRADPANAYTYDAYDLLSINERTVEYASVASAKLFVVRRVAIDFELKRAP
jgi:hypothetical protein